MIFRGVFYCQQPFLRCQIPKMQNVLIVILEVGILLKNNNWELLEFWN